MILKEILCWVRPGDEQAFTEAQESWRAVLALDGFLGQLGGWCEQDSQLAIVLGVWRDHECYDDFMKPHGVHDQVFQACHQNRYLERSEVRLHQMPAQCLRQHLRPERNRRTFSWLSPEPGAPARSMKLQSAWSLKVRESPLPFYP